MADEKIISLDEAKQKINESTVNTQKLTDEAFEHLQTQVQEILKAEGDEELMQNIGLLLALPEPEFALIAPLTLEELAKSYNRPDQQVTMAQMFNAAGITMEDFTYNFTDILDTLEKEFGDKLSKQKIDFLKEMLALTYNAVMETQSIDKRFIKIPYEICREGVKEPIYAHDDDAGMDVYALEDVTINPGETKIIPTGIKMEIPKGYAILVHPRSGTSNKTKLRVANSIGLIDSSYRGEIGVIIENIEPKIQDITVDKEGHITSIEYGKAYIIGKGERFAQLRLVEVPRAALMLVDKVNETERAEGGFGSTGA